MLPVGVAGLECLSRDTGLALGLLFASIVALSSHLASFSSSATVKSCISGRSAGKFTEFWLEARECERKCSRCDSLFSLFSVLLEALEDVEAFDALLRRENRLLGEGPSAGKGAGVSMSLANVGGRMSSWVFVSDRIMVNGGGEFSGGGGGIGGVTSSLIFSFFFNKSFKVMVSFGKALFTWS